MTATAVIGDAARVAVAFVLVAAAVTKAASPRSVGEAAAALGLPSTREPLLVIALVIGELLCAITLLTGSTPWAELPSTLLILVFIAVLVRLSRRAPEARCGCLGDLGAGGHGASIVRNAMLLGLLVLAAAVGTDTTPLGVTTVAAGVQVALLVLLGPDLVSIIIGLRGVRLQLR